MITGTYDEYGVNTSNSFNTPPQPAANNQTNTNMNKPDIIDHNIKTPNPRPYDHFTDIFSLEGELYNRGNYATLEEARKHGATSKFGTMDMGYSAILDGMDAVKAALYCVGACAHDLGCEIIVNGYRRFTDISLNHVDDALSSLIKPNQFNS